MIGGRARRSRRDSRSGAKSDPASSPFLGTGSEKLRFYALIAFLVICALGGGASRPDVLSLLYLRPASIICLLILVLTPGRYEFRRFRFLFVLLGLFAATMAIQLIPLPPATWLSFPGNARFAAEAAAAASPPVWRPLSLTPDLTLNSLLALLPPLVILVGMAAIREDQRRMLLPVTICIACADAAWSVVQFTSGADSATYLYAITSQGIPVGLFANRNHHAILAALAFPMLALWLRMPSRSPEHARLRVWIALTIGLFLIPVILVTGSRAGLVCGAVGILFALLLGPRPRAAGGRWDKIARGAVLALPVALVAATILASRATSLERFFESDAGAGGEVRLNTLSTLFQMIRDFLPQGTGYGGFDRVFKVYEPDAALAPTYLNHAHNDLVELVLTGGVPAAILLLVFLGWWIWRGSRAFQPSRAGSASAGFARLGAIMILLLLGASLVDYPLRTPMLSAVFALACGWLAFPAPSDPAVAAAAGSVPRRGGWVWRLAVAVPAGLALFWVAMGVTAARTIGEIQPSAVLPWWPFDADSRAGAASLLIQAGPNEQQLGEADSLARAALRREPVNIGAVRSLALIAAIRNQGPEAERLMRLAETLSRRDLPTELWLIEANVRRNDIEGALHHYDRALRTSLPAGEMLYPVLVQASASPDVMLPIARLVGTRPLWWSEFARRLVADGTSPAAIAAIIGALRLDPHVDAERGLLVAAMNKLVAAHFYDPAFALYRQAEHGAPALPLRNGDFQAENPLPPFDWALTEQSDLAGRIDSPSGNGAERALIVSAGNGASGAVARQLMVLAPGAYRLTAQVGNVGQSQSEAPQIVVVCAAGPQILLDWRWPASPAQGRAIDHDLTIPPQCPAEWITVNGNGPVDGSAPESWIDAIAIRRLP